MKIGLLIFILMATIQDIQCRKISMLLIIVGFVTALIYRIGFVEFDLLKLLIDVLPASLLFFLSYFGKELIGYGDVAIFGILGIVLGIILTLELLIISIVVNAIYGGIMLICRKKTLKDKIAFLPFIFIAYLISCYMI